MQSQPKSETPIAARPGFLCFPGSYSYPITFGAFSLTMSPDFSLKYLLMLLSTAFFMTSLLAGTKTGNPRINLTIVGIHTSSLLEITDKEIRNINI